MIIDMGYTIFSSVVLGLFVLFHLWARRRLHTTKVTAKQPRRKNQKRDWLSALVGSMILLTLAVGWFYVEQAAEKEREYVQQMLFGVAPTLAYEAQRMGHLSIDGEMSPVDPRYLNLIEAMKSWMALNQETLSIYTLRQSSDGVIHFVVAPETDYDRNGVINGDVEDRVPYGFPYDDYIPELEQAFAGKSTMQQEPNRDEWGYTVSAFAPILDPNGDTEAVLGVDFDGNVWEARIQEARMKAMWSLLVPLTMLFALYWITFRFRIEKLQIMNMAYQDELTELPNRRLFKESLVQSLEQARTEEHMLAIMFLDMDRFKIFNDSLGHSFGDRLLQVVAGRLRHCVGSDELVARLGGDEFTLLLPKIGRESEVLAKAQQILQVFEQPLIVEGQELYLTTSIGIALFPADGMDAETLMRNADAAMYLAKETGKNTFQFNTSVIKNQAMRKLELENDMRKALERSEFVVHYQPQVDISSGRIVGMEALVRWYRPDRGLISPGEFIPVAEETGLIVPIGEWVLREACRQNKAWQEAGYAPLRVAVNLSARQFNQPDLVGFVSRVLAETGLEPQYLELEITESMMMNNEQRTIAMLGELKQLGVRICIDDFGTGYSSLSYLKLFPLHTLKIDRAFVRDITTHPDETVIAASIIAMAHSLRLSVIAEGVEEEEQMKFLEQQGCDEMQGFLISRPLPSDAFEQLLKSEMKM